MELTVKGAGQEYTPPQAALYDQIARDLAANSRSENQFMREVGPELTSDMSSSDIGDVAMVGISSVSLHPLDALASEEKTTDVMAMVRAHATLESTARNLQKGDAQALADYARVYGTYRLTVLNRFLTGVSEVNSERYSSLQEEEKKETGQFYEIKQRAQNVGVLREACSTIVQVYTDLVQGQVAARLNKIGKDIDPELHDPTIERLTENDIRNAGYQYNLIIGTVLPTTTN